MDRILVVVDDSDRGTELLDEVDTVVSGTDVPVVVLSLVTSEEYGSDIETLHQVGEVEGTSYERSPAEFARTAVTGLVAESLDESVEYTIVGEVVDADDQADRILSAAREKGCDHVYLTGRRRSPTGKALFGDRAQKVVLNFDGYVTLRMTE